MNNNFTIILLDEIENHLHPSLLRSLIRELREMQGDIQLICTTHSAVVLNELEIEELIDAEGCSLGELDETTLHKLRAHMHPGRNEIMLAENIILVEGPTEELLLRHYLAGNNCNWTIVSVGGVMFEPYIKLACLLKKNVIVISDTDIELSEDGKQESQRFKNLENLCNKEGTHILRMHNTLESDLCEAGCIQPTEGLRQGKGNLMVARSSRAKMQIADNLVEQNVDLSKWHIIKELQQLLSEESA